MDGLLNNLKVTAIAAAVPQNEVLMTDFYSRFGENEVKRIGLNTGIKSVRLAPKGLKTSDLCISAANVLFEKLAINRSEIDALIFVSQTPDYRMPATSCILQDKLSLSKNIVTFDINYGCSAYVYGLYQAGLLVSSGNCKKVLLCVGDTISQYLDPDDQKTQLILGDGAAVSLIEQGEEKWAFSLKTDGEGYQALIIDKNNTGDDLYLKMDGAAIMEFALREVPPIIEKVIELKSWKKDEVGRIVFHQANSFMINYLRKTMRLAKDKVPIAVESYGNTGPASIPLTLCHQAMHDQVCNDENIILSGFGVGLSWGAVALSLANTQFLDVQLV